MNHILLFSICYCLLLVFSLRKICLRILAFRISIETARGEMRTKDELECLPVELKQLLLSEMIKLKFLTDYNIHIVLSPYQQQLDLRKSHDLTDVSLYEVACTFVSNGIFISY